MAFEALTDIALRFGGELVEFQLERLPSRKPVAISLSGECDHCRVSHEMPNAIPIPSSTPDIAHNR